MVRHPRSVYVIATLGAVASSACAIQSTAIAITRVNEQTVPHVIDRAQSRAE
jgi:hypothetical protein